MSRSRALVLLLATSVVACGSEATTTGPDAGAEQAAAAVVGVSFDAPLAGEVDHLVVDVAADGDEVVSKTLDSDGAKPVELELPAMDPGTRLQVRVIAQSGDEELLRQVMMTEVEADRTLLLPMRMNDECIPATAHRDVSCAASTCRAGVCQQPFVDPSDLEDYRKSWAKPPVGSCGGVDEGEPTITIGGEGESFVPLEDGEVVRPYRGLQGGMHLYLAVQMSGADEQSTTTHYFNKILSTGRESSVLSLEQPFEVEQDGCHTYMVPMVLPPVDVVGEEMRVGVTVLDVTGNAGHDHVDIVVGEPHELQ